LVLVFLFIHSNKQQEHERYVMNHWRTQEFFMGVQHFYFILFSNYNYNLIQYQQITVNNYSNSHNSYIHHTYSAQRFTIIGT
jgi:hypothetical protein